MNYVRRISRRLYKRHIRPTVCCSSGELDLHHPDPYQIAFSADSGERPPTMTWAYPEPRALSAVQLVPLPFSVPVLVNTINMGEEYQVGTGTHAGLLNCRKSRQTRIFALPQPSSQTYSCPPTQRVFFSLLLKVPCVLRYWDNAQKCYISYKDFFISESSPTAIRLPDPCIADPSEIIVASEWQIVVDVIGNIDYPEEFR